MGETSYMHILGQCSSLCADATKFAPSTLLGSECRRTFEKRCNPSPKVWWYDKCLIAGGFFSFLFFLENLSRFLSLVMVGCYSP